MLADFLPPPRLLDFLQATREFFALFYAYTYTLSILQICFHTLKKEMELDSETFPLLIIFVIQGSIYIHVHVGVPYSALSGINSAWHPFRHALVHADTGLLPPPPHSVLAGDP